MGVFVGPCSAAIGLALAFFFPRFARRIDDVSSDKLERVLGLFVAGHSVMDRELAAFVMFVEATVIQLESAT
jgi:hypothetical protein